MGYIWCGGSSKRKRIKKIKLKTTKGKTNKRKTNKGKTNKEKTNKEKNGTTTFTLMSLDPFNKYTITHTFTSKTIISNINEKPIQPEKYYPPTIERETLGSRK